MKKHLVLFAVIFTSFSNLTFAGNTEELVEKLKDKDASIAIDAAAKLGETKDRKALIPLLKTAEGSMNSSEQVRIAAIKALMNFRSLQVAKVMIAEVKNTSNSDELRQAAGKVLSEIPSKAVMRVFERDLRSGNKILQICALQSLGYIGNDGAVSLIAPALNDRHLQKEAIAALGNTGNPKATQILLKVIDDIRLCEEAAEALVNSNDPSVVKPLAEKLTSRRLSKELKLKILDYVIKSGHEDSVKYIKSAMSDKLTAMLLTEKLLESKDPKFRGLATESMAKSHISSSTLNAIESMLDSPKPEDLEIIGQALASGRMRHNDKKRAVDYLISSKDPKAITFLGRGLVTGKLWTEEKTKAVKHLLSSNKPEAMPFLGQAYITGRLKKDEQSSIYEYLAKSDSPEALTCLGQALNKGVIESKNRKEIIQRLGDSKEPANAQYLSASVRDRPNQKYAVDALLKIGGPEIAKPIAPAIFSADKRIRQKVYEILMAVEEPWVVPALMDRINNTWGVSRTTGPQAEEFRKLMSNKIKPEHIDELKKWLKSSRTKDYAIELLKEVNWQPETTDEKIEYYLAAKEWDKLKPLGEPAIKALLNCVQRTTEPEPVMTLMQMGAGRKVVEVLEGKIKRWSHIGKEQAEILTGQLGWTAKTSNDRVDLAIAIGDYKQIEKTWKNESQMTTYLISKLDSDSHVRRAVSLSISMKRKDMVSPIIARLNRIGPNSDLGVDIGNFMLNCGNEKLEKAAEEWGKRNGYSIKSTPFSSRGGSRW